MYTSAVVCRRSRHGAVNLLEIAVVVVIIGILATIAVSNWRQPIEREYESNARATLNAILRAEQDFFAYKNRYTSDWTALAIDDPNNMDSAYSYVLENVTESALVIRATRIGKSTGLTIDQDGTIQKF